MYVFMFTRIKHSFLLWNIIYVYIYIVIDENRSQESIWNDVGVPILNKAFNGYNGTIFAYGND